MVAAVGLWRMQMLVVTMMTSAAPRDPPAPACMFPCSDGAWHPVLLGVLSRETVMMIKTCCCILRRVVTC